MLHRPGNVGRLLRIEQHAAILHHLRHRTTIRTGDRQPGGHGLQQGIRHIFTTRGEDEEIGLPQYLGQQFGRSISPALDEYPVRIPALERSIEPALGRRPWAGARTVIVRGEGGRDWLAERLRAAGASVEFVQSYSRQAPRLDERERRLLKRALDQPGEVAWLMSSSEAVEHLKTLAPEASWEEAVALASHPRIAESARRLGFGRVVDVRPTPEAVAEALATL